MGLPVIELRKRDSLAVHTIEQAEMLFAEGAFNRQRSKCSEALVRRWRALARKASTEACRDPTLLDNLGTGPKNACMAERVSAMRPDRLQHAPHLIFDQRLHENIMPATVKHLGPEAIVSQSGSDDQERIRLIEAQGQVEDVFPGAIRQGAFTEDDKRVELAQLFEGFVATGGSSKPPLGVVNDAA